MGLPKLDHAGPVLKKGKSSGVFSVHVYASGGSKIRLVVEAPIVGTDAAAKGLFERKVGLDPGDPCQLMPVGEDSSPKITVLPRGQEMRVKNGVEPVRNITAVGKNVESARGTSEGLCGRGDFSPLGGLPRAHHCPFRTQDGKIGKEAPAGSGPPRGVSAPPVRGHAIDSVGTID